MPEVKTVASWSAAGTIPLALAVVAVILGLAMLSAAATAWFVDSTAGTDGPRTYLPGEREQLQTLRLALSLMAFQVVSIVLIWIAQKLWPGRAVAFDLQDAGGRHEARTGPAFWMFAITTLIVCAGLYGLLVYVVDRGALLSDVRPLRELMDNRAWWVLALAAIVGAPIAEELMFRGFLHSHLRATSLGFIGTALVTAIGWASLHFSYTVYGLAAIFLIGLYLAWLRERTGGIALPILAHATYNASVMCVMMFAPDWLFAQ